jgi:nicotinamide-nucleotide amidase
MPESDLDQLIAPVYTKYTNPATTVLAALGDIQVHLRARCESCDEADALLNEVCPHIEALLGDRIYTTTGEPLEQVIGNRLKRRGESAAVAESATSGMLAARLTAVAGASSYFKGGFLTYTDAVKHEILGVDTTFGAVSEPVARAMAVNARDRLHSTYAVSITGYAGPDGGTGTDPVGTVYIGIASPGACDVRRLHFTGDRQRIRTMAVQWALDLLRRAIPAA